MLRAHIQMGEKTHREDFCYKSCRNVSWHLGCGSKTDANTASLKSFPLTKQSFFDGEPFDRAKDFDGENFLSGSLVVLAVAVSRLYLKEGTYYNQYFHKIGFVQIKKKPCNITL